MYPLHIALKPIKWNIYMIRNKIHQLAFHGLKICVILLFRTAMLANENSISLQLLSPFEKDAISLADTLTVYLVNSKVLFL